MQEFRTVGGYEVFRDSKSDEDVKIHQLQACLDNDPHDVFNSKYMNIHHLNTIGWDNRVENLMLLRARYHRNLHSNISWRQIVTYYAETDVANAELQRNEKYYQTLTENYLSKG